MSETVRMMTRVSEEAYAEGYTAGRKASVINSRVTITFAAWWIIDNRIKGIKSIRTIFGLGLKEAKEASDKMMRDGRYTYAGQIMDINALFVAIKEEHVLGAINDS